MRAENPSWILVEGGDPEAIRRAVTEHSKIARPEEPQTHRVTVVELDRGRHGVAFDPPAPPYAFANLIGWLDDPRANAGARRAVGWLIAPVDGVRYFLTPERENAGGDTLLGVAEGGGAVSVFLPDCSVSPAAERVEVLPEPPLPATEPVVAFEVTLDGDTSFGNPQFAVG
jgi:hypothetical protein